MLSSSLQKYIFSLKQQNLFLSFCVNYHFFFFMSLSFEK